MKNRSVHYLFIVLLTTITIAACTSPKVEAPDAENLHSVNIALEKDIVHDFFSPPVASRIYLYPNLISYEIISQKHTDYVSLKTILPDFPNIPRYEGKQHEIASLYSFLLVAKELVYTTNHIETEIKQLDEKFATIDDLDAIKSYSKQATASIREWLQKDNYPETRNMQGYTLLEKEGSWTPTPPDYMDALEPHWEKIRYVTLDSANQFTPIAPTKYDLTKGSDFHKELIEVYEAVNTKTDSTEAIAKFWDCNPIISRQEGHITYSEKKLTPGGHWMNICRLASRKEIHTFEEVAYSYTSLSIGIFDAFISCWQTKYATHYIRPVTVIQNEIDPGWFPILSTPNFPEYTSGHSVVSRVAATLLTYRFGENYSFTDTTEVPFGMPPRSFSSFIHASDEAAISRFYGGIHFKPAIYQGIKQGDKVGKHVLTAVKKLKK
ncbi:vanadium-dependent haloperoxidase [Aquimarina rubra]|uniref:Vanadium-dependent haloperoxidase n=1 Tax=Aquimarina rubra TaxID=1920033 RepID=A0ABW5LBM3_9FLAO